MIFCCGNKKGFRRQLKNHGVKGEEMGVLKTAKSITFLLKSSCEVQCFFLFRCGSLVKSKLATELSQATIFEGKIMACSHTT